MLQPPLEPVQYLLLRSFEARPLRRVVGVAPHTKPMATGLIGLVLHHGHLVSRSRGFGVRLLHLSLLVKAHDAVLDAPAEASRHGQLLDVHGNDHVARVQRHHCIHQRHLFAVNLGCVASQPGSDRIPPSPTETNHADLRTSWSGTAQVLQEFHADPVGRHMLVPPPPHEERRQTGEEACIFGQGRLLGCINRDHHVGYLERHGVAFEEIRKVDQILSTLGIRIGNELVVGEQQAEDVGVHDHDGTWIGSVANHVGVEAVYYFLLALGLAFVDGALDLLLVVASVSAWDHMWYLNAATAWLHGDDKEIRMALYGILRLEDLSGMKAALARVEW